MKQLLFTLLLLVTLGIPGLAQAVVKYQGPVLQGNTQVSSGGVGSTNKVLGSYPSCTVSVYLTGTLTLATIYSDSILTPKSNPFTATSEGYLEFYAAPGTYDLRFSGTGITTPFTRSVVELFPTAAGVYAGTTNKLQKRTTTGLGDSLLSESGSTVTATGTVAITAGATVGTTLGVTGATTLSSTLGVTGAATISGYTDTAGGIYTRTAAQIAALTAGSKGRLLWQTDGLVGPKKDYGSDVGIRAALAYYNAYDLGFAPGDSANATRVLNSSKWTAFITALTSSGARVVFPEGTFYFASELSTTKPLIIEGAGASFVSGGTTAGTTIVVESGENGFEFLSGSAGSSVKNLTIKTRSGYSGVTTGDGVYSDVTIKLENLSIESMGRDGIFFNGTSPANSDFSSLKDINIWGVKRDGLHINGGNDANVITATNVNCTLNGRYGYYNAGNSNTFIGAHVSYSGQVTGTGKDYYDAGSSNVYILPYSESATGSSSFIFDTGAVRSTVLCGAFGAPTFDGTAGGFYGKHTILTDGRYRDLLLRGTANDGTDHDYSLISRNLDAAGGLALTDDTASVRVLSYNPSGTLLTLPNAQVTTLGYSGIQKATGTPQTLTGPGAVNLTTDTTYLVTTGANALTLADGVQGQVKTIRMKTDSGDGTLTPTNKEGFTTVTFNDVGDTVTLKFLDGKWNIVGYFGVTIA